jgi:hemerythrin-like domain-containing protein
MDESRRALVVGGVTLLAGRAHAAPATPAHAEVSPLEDLMREHGLLARILILYDECIRRLEARKSIPPETMATATRIVQRFIEGYHEKLEEEHLFPRFERAGQLVELVRTLRTQHEVGRGVTVEILRRAPSSPSSKSSFADVLREYVRMYRAHAAREDTVLFPALHALVSVKEYASLGEQFEDREHQLFGEGGFEKMVAEVAQLEEALGITDLKQFTAKPA